VDLRHSTRLDIRIKLNVGAKDATSEMCFQLQSILNKLIKADETIHILPWFTRDGDKTLENNLVPLDIKTRQKYYQRLAPNNSEYANGEFMLQHSQNWNDILYSLTPWLSDSRRGLFYHTLQCCNVRKLLISDGFYGLSDVLIQNNCKTQYLNSFLLK
jgi:hypothetical protein